MRSLFLVLRTQINFIPSKHVRSYMFSTNFASGSLFCLNRSGLLFILVESRCSQLFMLFWLIVMLEFFAVNGSPIKDSSSIGWDWKQNDKLAPNSMLRRSQLPEISEVGPWCTLARYHVPTSMSLIFQTWILIETLLNILHSRKFGNHAISRGFLLIMHTALPGKTVVQQGFRYATNYSH